MMFELNVPTKRGTVLNGVRFRPEEKKQSDTVMIAVTGIHGNFYSNPFYYNIGNTLNSGNVDFIYAQTNDAFGQINTVNIKILMKEKPLVPGMSDSHLLMRILRLTLILQRRQDISTLSWPDIPLALIK